MLPVLLTWYSVQNSTVKLDVFSLNFYSCVRTNNILIQYAITNITYNMLHYIYVNHLHIPFIYCVLLQLCVQKYSFELLFSYTILCAQMNTVCLLMINNNYSFKLLTKYKTTTDRGYDMRLVT